MRFQPTSSADPAMRAYLLLALMLSSSLPAQILGQPLSPEVALSRMQPADGLTIQLVAAEPLIRQPVTISFDSRGRLWVVQYLQYPTPAGLQAKEVDQFLRTRYDRKPEPPPRGLASFRSQTAIPAFLPRTDGARVFGSPF